MPARVAANSKRFYLCLQMVCTNETNNNVSNTNNYVILIEPEVHY